MDEISTCSTQHYVDLIKDRITEEQLSIIQDVCLTLETTVWHNSIEDALKNYTDHKLAHSYRVLARVLELYENAKNNNQLFKALSSNTFFAFALAALLHDISMAGNPKRDSDKNVMQYFDEAKKADIHYEDYPDVANKYTESQQAEIRKYHAYFSIAQIKLARAVQKHHLHNALVKIDEELIHYVYVLIQFHCSEKISAIPDRIDHVDQISDITLPFSALLFRLADELDLGQKRDIAVARKQGMSKKAEAHWEIDYRTNVSINTCNYIEIQFLANEEDIKKNKDLFNAIVKKHITKNECIVNNLQKYHLVARYDTSEDYTRVDAQKEPLSAEIISQLKEIISEGKSKDQEENERIRFLEKCVMDGFKIDKNYMGIIVPALGDKYKLYVYKEFTLLEPKKTIKCSIHIDSESNLFDILNKKSLNLSVCLSYHDKEHGYVNFFPCDFVEEVSRGEEHFQFIVQFAREVNGEKLLLRLKEGDKIAIFYTYDVYCAHYGHELVRKSSPFSSEDLQCEFVFPKKNVDYYNFTVYERNDEEKILMARIDNYFQDNDKSILHSIHASDKTFQDIVSNLFVGQNICRTVDYKSWMLNEKKAKDAICQFVACWQFVPFFTDPDMYLKAERYLNKGSPSGFTQRNITSEECSPFSDIANFNVNSFYLSENNTILNEYGKRPQWLGKNELLVHPDFEACFTNFDKVNSFTVVPTASSRTVFVEDQPGYVKLQYNKLLGRLERLFTPERIATAIEVSVLLTEKFNARIFDDGLYFLPEVYGKIFEAKNGEFRSQGGNGYWGMLVRSYVPYPKVTAETTRMIPAFSLFAKDAKCHFSRTMLKLLFDFCAEKSTITFAEFLLDKIIKPAYRLYFELLLETGLHIEGHAQNILYLLTIKGNVLDVKGVVIRDFESIDKDIDIMKKKGTYSRFKELKEKINDSSTQETYAKRNSFLFDFKLGEYLITPLIEHAEEVILENKDIMENMGDSKKFKENITKEIRKFNAYYINQLPANFFPKDKWFSYDAVEIDRSSKDRPWITKTNPKYR